MSLKRLFIAAWLVALLFYVLEYAVRSSPSVMIPQLSTAYGKSAVGVSAILVTYYYTYSVTSLVAGLALDRAGARYVVPLGLFVLGAGCIAFAIPSSGSATVGRLMQGAGSAFAFTGAVYLAVHGFSSKSLATAIGATQCMGMLGGFSGSEVVAPIIKSGVDWQYVWYAFGACGLLLGVVLMFITPGGKDTPVGAAATSAWWQPYKIVFTNPQSYLCGLVAGFLFVPTTIGAMTWGISFFEHDGHYAYSNAVLTVSMLPLGWVFGCPLMGFVADKMRARKPVLIVGIIGMALVIAQLSFSPDLVPAIVGFFVLGILSGVAMIPYTIIKEANPDEVKGCATGAINFLNFGISSLVGPVFGHTLGSTLLTTTDPSKHFREFGTFWLGTVVIAGIVSLLLRETGSRASKAASQSNIVSIRTT